MFESSAVCTRSEALIWLVKYISTNINLSCIVYHVFSVSWKMRIRDLKNALEIICFVCVCVLGVFIARLNLGRFFCIVPWKLILKRPINQRIKYSLCFYFMIILIYPKNHEHIRKVWSDVSRSRALSAGESCEWTCSLCAWKCDS